MMDEENGKLTTAIAISLVVHAIIFLLAYLYLNQYPYNQPREQVIEINLNPNKDWKIADIAPPKIEERPDKARHLGVHDSKVDKETVAAMSERAPGRPVSRGGEGIEKLKKSVKDVGKVSKDEMVLFREKERLPDRMPSSRMPEDFYPDYKLGQHTYINVLKHPDVAYFVRLKRVFKLAWDPSSVLRGRRLSGEISRGSIKVVLGLAIDSSGNVNELFVINSSGMKDYDYEAVRAVKASAPFASPPAKLLEKDRILRVSWTFVVYL